MPAPVVNTIPLDAGLVYVGTTFWGVTRGGPKFANGTEWREIEWDGRRAKMVGHSRIVGHDATVTFEIIELSYANIQRLLPGHTAGLAGGISTFTPKKAGVLLVSADYLTNFLVAWKLPDATFIRVRFPKAFVSGFEGPSGEDKNEAGIQVTVSAALDGADPDVSPWVLELSPLATSGV